jgi:hypothetical protein
MSSTKPFATSPSSAPVSLASWASLFLAKGLHVVATNIAPNAEAALRNYVEVAWSALERLGLSPGASQSSPRVHN